MPGDYNLEFLDYFENDDTLTWVGNANELNAAYAADGYARVKSNLAVVVTTFGVGELSALNGIAGCLAERIPVLHIVGAPSTSQQKNQSLLHHTLNTPGSFDTFRKMSEPLSCAQALLSDVRPDSDTVYTDVFDEALRACLIQCRPAYVELPMDCVRAVVSAKGLQTPLVRSLCLGSWGALMLNASRRPIPPRRSTNSSKVPPPDRLRQLTACSGTWMTTLTCRARR